MSLSKEQELQLYFLQERIEQIKIEIAHTQTVLSEIRSFNQYPWKFKGRDSSGISYRRNEITERDNASYIYSTRNKKSKLTDNRPNNRVLSVEHEYADENYNVDLGEIQYKTDFEIFKDRVHQFLKQQIDEMNCGRCTTKTIAQEKIGALETYLRDKIQKFWEEEPEEPPTEDDGEIIRFEHTENAIVDGTVRVIRE